MTLRALAFVLLTSTLMFLVACGAARPVEQTTITRLREQDALVMAPELPGGMGAPLQAGGGSLSLGAGLTGARPARGNVGQQAIPVNGLLRGATGVDDGVELVASGALGSPDVDPGPLAEGVEGTSGVLGRGALGMRVFVPMKTMVDWGFSVDVGAEASHLRQTDTVTVTVQDRSGITSEGRGRESRQVRVHPHFRTATVVRAPLPIAAPVTALVGFQLQTWPVYWKTRQQVDTCTLYESGAEECSRSGAVGVPPSPVVAVWTPTLGATVPVAGAHLHLQGFVNLGPTGVDAVPWGAMATIEGRTRTSTSR